MRNVILAIATIAAGLKLTAGEALAQSPYPLVFDSLAKLKQAGIALLLEADDRTKGVHFPTRCYYYGDGGWDISISNALLDFYKSQGFSRRSACMALVSGVRFDPQTGKRLASYILVNRSLIENGKPTDAAALSDELPLSLPTCFARGLPYTDCAWNFDPLTGRKLAAAKTNAYRAVGARIEKLLGDPSTRGAFRYMKDDSPYTKGQIMVGAATSVDQGSAGQESAASFYDYSPEFPKGYGYALYADGGAAPDVSPEVVKMAVDRRRPPAQLDPSKLKDIWGAGSQ